jgi:LCP family protein required for cell wall assembly
MGLESRTNFQGECLSESLLTVLHAGNAASCADQTVGAQDTDTLILVHIFADAKKAVGYSIPRDDLVTYPHATLDGITQGKIDQAYDFAYNVSLDQTINTSDSSSERYLLANKAGQAFEIATVESVTGVHIDHFVESNLEGFFYLAQAFGGIEVCVEPWTAGGDANLADQASGWNAVGDGYNVKKGGDQYLHLAADQALAYVRDRDSLPEIDLDRTHRQQAVIDYVVWKLKHDGAFSDISSLDSLLGGASQWLITDSTFSLLDFATNMRALSGSNMTFETLPIASETSVELNGSMQDVNTINVPYVQQLVQSTFGTPSPGTESATPAATPTPSSAPQSTGAKVVGGQASPTPAATGSPTATPSPATTAGANDGQTGGTVTVGPNAPYGVPCVY